MKWTYFINEKFNLGFYWYNFEIEWFFFKCLRLTLALYLSNDIKMIWNDIKIRFIIIIFVKFTFFHWGIYKIWICKSWYWYIGKVCAQKLYFLETKLYLKLKWQLLKHVCSCRLCSTRHGQNGNLKLSTGTNLIPTRHIKWFIGT